MKIRKIPQYIFVAINTSVCVAMNFCAYSQYLHPHIYPNWSYFGMMFPVFLVLTVLFIPFWLLVTKWKCGVVSVVGMLMCAGSVRSYCPINLPSTPPDDAIKVISYNIMNLGGEESREPEESIVLQYLLAEDADIVCIQEASGMVDTFKPLYEKVYPYSEICKDKNITMGILSKHPIISTERIDYESNTNCSHAFQLAVKRKDGSGVTDTVLVVNNHLEGYKLDNHDKDNYKEIVRNPENDGTEQVYDSLTHKIAAANAIRSIQADSVAEYIDRQPQKYKIVCGDFNDNPISYTHHRLTRTLDDAYTMSGNGPGISYNRNGMYFRIDNILVSPNIEAFGAKVDTYSKVSDHYPIISWLKLQ